MRTLLATLAAAGILAAGAANAQVVVSSKIDTEGGVLGNMILQALDDAGIETLDRLQLGGTPIVREAITAGEIDVYPEYTGNAAFFFNEADSDVWKSFEAGYERAAELEGALAHRGDVGPERLEGPLQHLEAVESFRKRVTLKR